MIKQRFKHLAHTGILTAFTQLFVPRRVSPTAYEAFRGRITALKYSVVALVLFGSTLFASAQTLNWSNPIEYSGIQVGGQANGLGGVGSAAWNGRIWVAYADNSGNGKLWLTSTADGVSFSTPVSVQPSQGPQTVVITTNPSLAVFSGKLYIAYIDNYSNPDWISTSDGKTFSNIGAVGVLAQYSPSLTVFNSVLYLAFGIYSGSSVDPGQLGIVKIPATGQASEKDYANIMPGDSPALGTFNNKIYVAYKDTSGSNYIYLGSSSDGTNFSVGNGATSSHTSTAPSITTRNGYLYIAFRQNSSGNRLYYTYSSDGSNFSGPIEVSHTMGGPPSVSVFPTVSGSAVSNHIFNIFRQNDTGHYLFTMNAP